MPVMLSEGLLGRRVVLRHRRPVADGLPPLSDLVGVLSELTAESATVETRRGPVTVARSAVLLARPVSANRRAVLELERISRAGWRAAEHLELDGWLLFADRGWTGRANSVLPLRTPAQPLERLLDRARGYYAERGLALQIQLPMPARGLLDAELAARCWTIQRPTVVLTKALDAAAEPAAIAGYQLQLAAAPDADWLAGYHYRGGPLPAAAAQLLARHDRAQFASIRQGRQVVAIARGVVDEGWLGVSAVEVAPEHRRRGLAVQLMRQLAAWGVGQRAVNCYLQVDEANTAALALYARLGFIEHHRYHYRLEPPGAAAIAG